MPKSKAKTKRDPNSKPKNQLHLINYNFFNGNPEQPHIHHQRKRRRENFFYTVAIMVFALMFIGMPLASILGNQNQPTNPQDRPAVSSTPDVNLTTGVDGHLSDGNIDPSEVEDEVFKQSLEQQQQAEDTESSTTTENAE